jgi:hypothetical protein
LGLLQVYLDRILDQDWRPETVPDNFPYTPQEKAKFFIGRLKNLADPLNGLNMQFRNAGQVLAKDQISLKHFELMITVLYLDDATQAKILSGKIGERVYGEVKIVCLRLTNLRPIFLTDLKVSWIWDVAADCCLCTCPAWRNSAKPLALKLTMMLPKSVGSVKRNFR